MFLSCVKPIGKHTIGVILTGMGRDGANGLLALSNAGAYTIAQDEATCVVFGMPQKAIEIGAVKEVLPLDQISSRILSLCKNAPTNNRIVETTH
jgi:two-component system chemotaxis response regulator CheB